MALRIMSRNANYQLRVQTVAPSVRLIEEKTVSFIER